MYRVIADRIMTSDEGKRVRIALPSFVIDQAEDGNHALAIAGMIVGHDCHIQIVRLS